MQKLVQFFYGIFNDILTFSICKHDVLCCIVSLELLLSQFVSNMYDMEKFI